MAFANGSYRCKQPAGAKRTGAALDRVWDRGRLASLIHTKEKRTMSAEARLKELGITLPTPPKPVAKYKPTVLVGNVLYVSGHGPAKTGDPALLAGKVGSKLTLEQGKQSA